jgi:hypothetical protein
MFFWVFGTILIKPNEVVFDVSSGLAAKKQTNNIVVQLRSVHQILFARIEILILRRLRES